jgi:hypothetical protein
MCLEKFHALRLISYKFHRILLLDRSVDRLLLTFTVNTFTRKCSGNKNYFCKYPTSFTHISYCPEPILGLTGVVIFAMVNTGQVDFLLPFLT